MKRIISLFLIVALAFCMLPVSASADEAQLVHIVLIHKESNADGVRKNLSVIEAGEELLFSGEDLAELGGFAYRIEKGSAYFTRGMKTLRVDLAESRLYPMEEFLSGKYEFAEKVQEIDGVYYFPGSEMLPWLNVTCFLHDGELHVHTDELSIWEIIPQFAPDEFAFDFTACCEELGENGKYLKARAYIQDEGISGVFFDLIPYAGEFLDYYDLFEDALQDQSATEKKTEKFLEEAEDVAYWMDIVEDYEAVDGLPDQVRVFCEAAKVFANNAISFAFELGTYIKHFYLHDKTILTAMQSMNVNAARYGLPDAAQDALSLSEDNYSDYYSGIGYKMLVAISETSLDGLADTAKGLYKAAVLLLGFADATAPDWAEGINRVSSYDIIAEFCRTGYDKESKGTHMSSIRHARGFAYMYLYACEQNWKAMADYAEKEGELDLQEKYKANAEAAEEWQWEFLKAADAEQNDSHEYGDATGGMKQEYTDQLKTFFSEVVRSPDYSAQEKQFEEFLQSHPEYNYYAFLDINADGILEMLAARQLDDRDGVFLSYGEYVDLYIFKDDAVTLAYQDIRSKYTGLAYDAENQRLVSSIGGSDGSGISYVSLDGSLTARESSFDAYCERVDENGNEVWRRYYNGVEINEETRQKYEDLYNSWKTSTSEVILFQPVPKAALIGEWNLYPAGVPHEDGYWFNVLVSELNLEADGTADVALGVVQGECYEWYSGSWNAVPDGENEFVLELNVTGGELSYSDEGEDENRSFNLVLCAKLDDECLVLERISGDDIGLYYSEAYERGLEFETWVERQGPVADHVTYKTLLWQYSEYAEYTLHDINKDGQDELIIREWNSYYIYTHNGTKVTSCGEFYWNYSPDCLYSYDGNGIVVYDGGTGSLHLEYVTLYSLHNGILDEDRILFDTESHTESELQSYLSDYESIENFLSVIDESLLDEQ